MSDEIDYKAEVTEKFAELYEYYPNRGVYCNGLRVCETWQEAYEKHCKPTLPPMDGKGVELPGCGIYVAHIDEVPALGTKWHEITDPCTAEEVVIMWRKLKALYKEKCAALQQAEQQRETLLEKACWADAQRIIAEANLDQAQEALAEAKLLDVERVKHSHALSETVNELRLLLDDAQKALAAEAWIEIKEGCEMPKHNEHVLVQHMAGYWTKWHFLRKFQGDFAKDCTHWRRITPPAGAAK